MTSKVHRFLLVLLPFTCGCCYSQHTEDIILVNVGSYDKGRIARLISKVDSLNPKVISLDIAFPDYNGNNDDKNLSRALDVCKNLVVPTTIESIDSRWIYFALVSRGEFTPVNKKTGFVSAKVEEGQIEIPKKFMVQCKDSDGYTEYHFSIQTALSFDSLVTANFIKNNPQNVDVDYKNGRLKFKTFTASEVLSDKLTRKDIEGKIVMMGFLGPGEQDKFFSPLSTNHSNPDMYGLEYLAIIVAQVLENE